MNEKDVLKKLSALKEIKPDAEWKTSSRDLLLSRISNSSAGVKISFIDEILFETRRFFSFLSRPAFAVLSLLLLVSGGVFTVNASRNTKPGDSFYAAKVFGQKARVAVVVDREAKAKMEMKYASARAKEISAVLADPSFNKEDNKKKTDKLTESFKAEIKTVAQKYEEISGEKTMAVSATPEIASIASSAEEEKTLALAAEDDVLVFAADSLRASSGIQISSPTTPSPAPTSPSTTLMLNEEKEVAVVSTSTSTGLKKDLSDITAAVETSDFAAAKDMLDKIDVEMIISVLDQGKVKGVSETATSVPAVSQTVSSSEEIKQ